MITGRLAVLYQDKEQGIKFLKESILKDQQFAYNQTENSALVYYSETDITEYILCKCDIDSVMNRFCGAHLSGYLVTDAYESYSGEALMYLATRIRRVV